MFGGYSEASFVFSSVCEFVKAWDSGADSKLILESRNGHVQMSFNCDLGKPNDQHFDPAKLFKKTKSKPTKPKPKSQKKRERDNLCAKLYQQKLSSQNKDSVVVTESEAAPATSRSAEATSEPGDNIEDEETSEDESGDDTISLSTSELDNVIETSDNINEVTTETRDYLPLAQARTLTWAESAKTVVTEETVFLRSEFGLRNDGEIKTFKLRDHPCWEESEAGMWHSLKCVRLLNQRLISGFKNSRCICGGGKITARDVMSKPGWQYDHGYCEGNDQCLRDEQDFMCWRARITVMLEGKKRVEL